MFMIVGDIYDDRVLAMAKVKHADAIFLMSKNDHFDMEKNSNNNDLFLVLACKRFSSFCQIPISISLYSSASLLHDWADWDVAVSTQELKMSILVKNSYISGFSSFITNLISTTNVHLNENFEKFPWIIEYCNGLCHEIYIVQVPEGFQSMKFDEFVKEVYLQSEVLVIGIKKKSHFIQNEIFSYNYLINPLNYLITEEDQIIIIALDYDSACEIFELVTNNRVDLSNSYN